MEQRILSRDLNTLVTIDEKSKVITIEKKYFSLFPKPECQPFIDQQLNEFRSDGWDKYNGNDYTVVFTTSIVIDDGLDAKCLIWFLLSNFKIEFNGTFTHDGAEEFVNEVTKRKPTFFCKIIKFSPKYADYKVSKFSNPDDQPTKTFATLKSDINGIIKAYEKQAKTIVYKYKS